MDFQSLFKRKEEGRVPTAARENMRAALRERDILVHEGELLDGKSSPPLLWSNVGGAIRIKAEKILGIMDGQTRIKAAVLHEVYPRLFVEPPNPGTEFSLPLQAVVMQLEDLFAGMSSNEADDDYFDTPFGQLAREDEARFTDKHHDQPKIRSSKAPRLYMHSEPLSQSIVKESDESTGLEKLIAKDFAAARAVSDSSGVRGIENNNSRREGFERLQELYLTDQQLDGCELAALIKQLPRVSGVVIMLSDGAVLGGGLSDALSETLINRTPDFLRQLKGFTQKIPGGQTRFATFSGDGCQVSLAISEDALILVEHEGKNLPPGLRERLVATAQALNLIYGSETRNRTAVDGAHNNRD